MQKPLVCCYMGVSECFSDIWKIGWGLLNSPGMCYCFIPFHIMGSELPMSEHSLCKAFSGTDNRLNEGRLYFAWSELLVEVIT